MYGKGILKGLSVTWHHFWMTYIEDLSWFFRSLTGGSKRYYTPEGIAHRSSKDARGIFTIQYPEEQLLIPEEFRYIPFLVYNELESNEKEILCTSCGICAKVCPPQCIWIVSDTDLDTGKTIPQPAEFYIDVDMCMSCGFCVEYCPFDAIKMDHDFEIASYSRNIYNMDKLLKPSSYYEGIRPENAAREEEARRVKEEANAARAAKRAAAKLE